MKALKAVLSVVLGLLVGVTVLGFALMPAASRAATTWGVERYSTPVGWLSTEEMEQAAQAVWGFSVKGDPATLPDEINGYEAFPSDQVEHLRDVQSLLNATWTGIVVTIIAISALSPLYVRLYGRRSFGRTLTATGVTIFALLLVFGVAAAIDFNRFFDLFHEILFPAGTWVFSANSLLICCFPEQFWAYLGLVWLVGMVVFSTAATGLGIALSRRKSPSIQE